MVRHEFFSWREIESADYKIYIQNLRETGCPDGTVRDIIVADVNQLFARRRAAEIVYPEDQWWRSTPDPAITSAAKEKLEELEKERRILLTELLGKEWDNEPTIEMETRFNGPVLGQLSMDIRRQVLGVEESLRKQEDALRNQAAEEGRQPHQAAIFKLEHEARQQLARILSSEQLEEYLLRNSRVARNLRDSLQGLELSPDQFRTLFRASDSLDLELVSLGTDSSSGSARRRSELETEREQTFAKTLGPTNYAVFKLNQDPVFREARDKAEGIGASPETVLPLYQLNLAVEEERRKLLYDPSMTQEEQSEQLALLYQQQIESLRKLLGEDGFRRYQASELR